VGSQNQYTKTVIIAADPNGAPNLISWTAFKTVLTVDRTDDISANPTPQCPSAPGTTTCTLRQAMLAGTSAAAPLLIQFDPVVFPPASATTVQLSQATALPIAGYQMTIDGTDPDGNPSLRGDPYHRVVVLPASGATFTFSNQFARLVGLSINRPTLSNGATPQDVIRFDGTLGPCHQSAVINCRINGGGSALTAKLSAHDCISGFGGAGANWATANVVHNTEVTACPDKGVKSTTLAHLTVQNSWLHHNLGGGVQATLSGNIKAEGNVIEFSGYNATTQVTDTANGLAANGSNSAIAPISPNTPSELETNGNIVRSSSARGISVQELSTATITNDFSCGAINAATNGQNGIAIFNSTASAASAVVRGTTSIYNGRNGATVTDQSIGDFGQDVAHGNNAFTQNATNSALGGHNLDGSTAQATVSAIGNQWQHCYADPSNPGAVCDGPIALDLNGSINASAPQPYRAAAGTLPVVINSIVPAKAAAGDLVRIVGSGFNAIDSFPSGGNCTTTIQQNNTCDPLVGNCVQYETSTGQWLDLPVQAVTPTHLVVQLPANFTCARPGTLRVQRRDYTGAIVSGTTTFCTNS
jgi:hypothetical protein